jgi:hypothetical protein
MLRSRNRFAKYVVCGKVGLGEPLIRFVFVRRIL